MMCFLRKILSKLSYKQNIKIIMENEKTEFQNSMVAAAIWNLEDARFVSDIQGKKHIADVAIRLLTEILV